MLTDNRVIQEILDTEKTYNDSLRFINRIMSYDNLIENHQILIEIRPLLTYLATISDSFLDNINKADAADVSDKELGELRAQRMQLLNAFFNVYTQYNLLFNQFNKITDSFEILNNFIKGNNNNTFVLADYLVQPMQRGPRYEMLVSAVLKNPSNLDAAQLQQLQLLHIQIKTCLDSANAALPVEPKSYQVGDFTKSGVTFVGNSIASFWNRFSASVPQVQADASQVPTDEDSDFVIIPNG